MIYRIFIEQGILKVKYSTEVECKEMNDYCFGKDIEIYYFEELWEKYIVTDADEINVELAKPSEQQQKNKSKILQWIEDNKMTEREKELQEDKYTLQEEVELLQDTIQDMEEEIKTLNIIIKYLENKAGL
jgi:protoporphyrinogen oxidase